MKLSFEDVKDKNSLEQALLQFNDMSEKLVKAYAAIGERMSEYDLCAIINSNEKTVVNGTVDILESIPAGVVIIDNNGVVLKHNSLAAKFFKDSIQQQKWSEVIVGNFKPQEDDGHEITLYDGRLVKIATSALDKGQLILIHDLTETRMMQLELAKNKQLALIGKMVASLSHQIKTPLSSATLYASNLASEEVSYDKRKKMIPKLQQQLKRITQIIDDMLLFAKGGNSIAQKIKIHNVLEDVKDEAAAYAALHNVKLNFNENSNLSFYGNKKAITAAILNVVINAIDASNDEDEVSVFVRKEDEFIVIEIIDQGEGIGRETFEKIIEPFFTTKTNGTGLGLAITKTVVESHNGRINIDSSYKSGLKMIIKLPASDLSKEGC